MINEDLLRENTWKAICAEIHGKAYDYSELLPKGKGKIISSNQCGIICSLLEYLKKQKFEIIIKVPIPIFP